jgi:ferredoxin
MDDDAHGHNEHGAMEGHSSNTTKKKKRSRGATRDQRDSSSRDCEHNELRDSRDYWREKSAQLEVCMQGMKEEHGAEMRSQQLQYLSLRGEWGRQKLELAACQDQLEDAEMARAHLEINNEELFLKLHGLNTAIARMQQRPSAITANSSTNSTIENTKNSTLCMCCCEANIDTVFRCKHAVMCEDCVVRMLNHADESDNYNDGEARCPVCRDPITFSNAGQSSGRSSDHDFLLAPYTRIYIGA